MKPKDAAIAEILHLSRGVTPFKVRRVSPTLGAGILDGDAVTVAGVTTPLHMFDIRGLNIVRNQLRKHRQKLDENS